VLDDQVPADRLDVDHAAPLLVGRHACAAVALRAGLVRGIGEPEGQASRSNSSLGVSSVRRAVWQIGIDLTQMNPGWG
jgi:hypothetical protein